VREPKVLVPPGRHPARWTKGARPPKYPRSDLRYGAYWSGRV